MLLNESMSSRGNREDRQVVDRGFNLVQSAEEGEQRACLRGQGGFGLSHRLAKLAMLLLHLLVSSPTPLLAPLRFLPIKLGCAQPEPRLSRFPDCCKMNYSGLMADEPVDEAREHRVTGR